MNHEEGTTDATASPSGSSPTSSLAQDGTIDHSHEEKRSPKNALSDNLVELELILKILCSLKVALNYIWEGEGISTDLVPTLLNMYDALYIRLKDDDEPEKTSPVEGEEDQHGNQSRAEELANSCADTSTVGGNGRNPTTKENGENGAKYSSGGGGDRVKENGVLIDQTRHPYPCIDRLQISENNELDNENQLNNNILGSNNSEMCKKCDVSRTSSLCQCSAKESITESITSLFDDIERKIDRETVSHYDNLGRRLTKEHIYAVPNLLPKHSPNKLSPKVPETPTSPPGFDPRKFKDVYRPLSSISSSSSSSSNSLPRRSAPVNMSAYLASAESLEDNDADHSDTEETTRRRDRTIKARREKAMRTGSGDSGVQCHSISLPAPPLAKPRYCDPNLAYMDRIVLEIIETEAVYVSNLKEVIEGYLEQWRPPESKSGISQQNVDDLFSNIEQIYRFNREFSLELEQCGVDPVKVARCFVRNNTGFVIYTEYCTKYPRTMSVLTELMRSEQAVRAFREKQVALGHTLPLGSYLLKPVQRILKYHLLLGNIVKHFEKDKPGYSEVVDALSSMTEMAHHINDMKRKHEHAIRVQEIQSLLYGWQGEDLTTYGELNAEGTFRMFGAKGLRHVFLFDKMILIAKKKEDSFLMYKTHILCSNLMLIESVPGEPFSFHIIPFDNPRLQYTLEARNLDQKREWTLLLKRVILENYSAIIPEHARQLVMTLGQNKPEDITDTTKGKQKAHHAPEYLERRKERRRSEGLLNTRFRLRRSSRTRKDKEEKGSRSRSVSRNRETEDDEPDRKISTTSCPGTNEKPKLKLSMWRRRSEPHVGSQDSLPLSISTSVIDDNPDTPDTTPCDPPTSQLLHASQNGLPSQEVSAEGLAMSENDDREDDGDVPVVEDEDAEQINENLEEVIRQMLHFKLQEQQLILSKQRRGIIRKKQLPSRYENSDTENEDGPSKNTSDMYGGVYGADMDSVVKEEEITDYVNFFFKNMQNQTSINTESIGGSSSEGQSLYSSALSVNQVGDEKLYTKIKPSNPVRRSSSDLSFKRTGSLKKSNYDNLINIWSSIRGKSPEKRLTGILSPSSLPGQLAPKFRERPQLRRAQSFTGESKNSDHYSSSSQLLTTPNTAPVSFQNHKNSDVWLREENRDRPNTIALSEDRVKDLEQYLQQSGISRLQDRFPYDTEDGYTDYSMTPHMSMDNILSIHPEHKIYKSTQKLTLRSVFRKITNPRATKSEPSGSVFNYSMDSELDKSDDKNASKMVYNMARQCSRTLKERVQQITAEDGEKSPVIKTNSEPIYAIPIIKQQQYNQYYSNQGINSIGARLACTNEATEYAVPRIQKTRSELRPDSVLSSSSILTSSSSSSSTSNHDTKGIESTEISSMTNMQEQIENIQENSQCVDSDASGDSYYERSFDQLEEITRDELFRDSAIYSDTDDIESPPPSLKQELRITSPIRTKSGSKISPRPSFKESLKNVPSTQIPEISEENLSDPLEISSDEKTIKEILFNKYLSPQLKRKVPPPVPAKPDMAKAYKKQCGSLIMQQLKNLEECSSPLKYNREDQLSPAFDGIKSVGERLKDLEIQETANGGPAESSAPKATDKEDSISEWSIKGPKSPTLLTPIIKNPITLSPLNIISASSPVSSRSKSVSPKLSLHSSPVPFETSSPVQNPNSSPNKSIETSPLPVHKCLLDEEVDEEPLKPRGWVKHVIGKLQAESDV
ncbi:unnamed protein product, partial [Meganyctiphanes norvegica]